MNYKITVLAGDGIGPEVMAQGLKVLNAAAKKFNFEIETEDALIGATAIDQTGNPLPNASIESCKKADAVLLGAVGHPRPNIKSPSGTRLVETS